MQSMAGSAWTGFYYVYLSVNMYVYDFCTECTYNMWVIEITSVFTDEYKGIDSIMILFAEIYVKQGFYVMFLM